MTTGASRVPHPAATEARESGRGPDVKRADPRGHHWPAAAHADQGQWLNVTPPAVGDRRRERREETAAAVAGKCQVVYTKKQADLESARLADSIIEAIGVGRYRSLDVL